MHGLDYAVLVVYFTLMAGIGFLCMRLVKKQEDYFMGGRSFGKLLQTFAAFGAGTGANDPIQVGRTTWTSGLRGIWSVLLWLFLTPFYWIFAVWYRRMRHLTLGDWFVERYDSKGLGAAYTVFAFAFCMMYLSTMFAAISKVAASIVNYDVVTLPTGHAIALEYVLVPLIAMLVIVYGVLGGLRAAYWTDLIQGICILFLSVVLVPFGLLQLTEKYGDEETAALVAENGQNSFVVMYDGFRILHDRVTDDYFQIIGGSRASEFPLHYIISLALLALLGIVVQPHFIATGGGSAKTENSARMGLVVGNFLKRFCTIGWALTGLILIALMAGNTDVADDPDKVWGLATRTILEPVGYGLVGLMLACLLAALMSSADCYMIVMSALVVRNLYAAYITSDADEAKYIRAGRIASVVVVAGGATVSLFFMDVFGQFKLALEVAAIFAAPFWVGLFWRRANRTSTWLTLAFSTMFCFVIPFMAPVVAPSLRTNPDFAITNDIVETTVKRTATAADVERRGAQIIVWEKKHAVAEDEYAVAVSRYQEARAAAPADDDLSSPENAPAADLLADDADATSALAAAKRTLEQLGERPAPVVIGGEVEDKFSTGGKSIFWSQDVAPIRREKLVVVGEEQEGAVAVVMKQHAAPMQGNGRFQLDFLLYQAFGLDLKKCDNAMLETLRLPPRLVLPFLVMIGFGFITKRTREDVLDRYYVKMKTPVAIDPEDDKNELKLSYENPDRFNHKRMFPGGNLEFQKPTTADVVGFVSSFGICFLFVWLAIWLTQLGS